MSDGGQILRHYRAITNKVVAWVRNIVAHCIPPLRGHGPSPAIHRNYFRLVSVLADEGRVE
jgi:hypothetical protein